MELGNKSGNPGQVARLRTINNTVDIVGFFELISELLSTYIKATTPPMGITPIYVEEFPKERLTQPDQPFDVITFKVRSVKPSASTNDGRIGRGLFQRDTFQNPNSTNYNVEIWGKWEDFEVEFDIWSRTNAVANRLAVWFHKFMYNYGFLQDAFSDRGVTNFEFVERLTDSLDTVDGQEVYRRSLIYKFRLDNLFAGQKRKLTQLKLNLDPPGVSSITLPKQ